MPTAVDGNAVRKYGVQFLAGTLAFSFITTDIKSILQSTQPSTLVVGLPETLFVGCVGKVCPPSRLSQGTFFILGVKLQ